MLHLTTNTTSASSRLVMCHRSLALLAALVACGSRFASGRRLIGRQRAVAGSPGHPEEHGDKLADAPCPSPASAGSLRFQVKCTATQPGEHVYVVGSVPELGSWELANALQCSTDAQNFPTWTSVDVPIASLGKVSFKVVVAKPKSKAAAARWEGGENKEVALDSLGHASLVVRCAYGAPGVELVAEAGDELPGASPSARAQEETASSAVHRERNRDEAREASDASAALTKKEVVKAKSQLWSWLETRINNHRDARKKTREGAKSGGSSDASSSKASASGRINSMDMPVEEALDSSACLKLRLGKDLDRGGVSVVVCGEVASLGSWVPAAAAPMSKLGDLWVLPDLPAGVKAGTLFKYVLTSKESAPVWESIGNRKWDASTDVAINVFNSMRDERSKQNAAVNALDILRDRPVGAEAENFIRYIADENGKRISYRLKIELPQVIFEEGRLNSLSDLACLQAYLTWVASGQITCKEDGHHHRPCHAAKSAQAVFRELWQIARMGDVHRFIARRIFPSLPSFSDEFTTTVPMTRIRDITHAWPHHPEVEHGGHKSIKLFLKHEIQNKLHRCADPGDLVKLDQLIDRFDRENGCGFPREQIDKLKVFQVELKDFFNAAGLDDSARKLAEQDRNLKPSVDELLWLKNEPATPFDQMRALTQLRELVAPNVEVEQNWMRLDVELDKYAFVLLSQIANDIDQGSRGTSAWWHWLLQAIGMALAQLRLAGVSPEECAALESELQAVSPDIAQGSDFARQRVVASMDRVLRICFSLQEMLEEAYASVPSLGNALDISTHAISVFVEAELRASIIFQLSKLAQSAMQQAKASSGAPAWTAISAGITHGRLVSVASLADAWSEPLPQEGAILFCDEATGDEEVPGMVRGIVVARDLPVLSHLALRARQMGVVFACSSEYALFEKLRSAEQMGSAAKLTVEAAGAVRLEPASAHELAENGRHAVATVSRPAPKLGALSLTEDNVVSAISIAGKPEVAGDKAQSCGKLEKLCKSIGCTAPQGLAIPFGVMKQAVGGTKFDAALKSLSVALDSSRDVEAQALAVRAAVEACKVPSTILEDIMNGLPDAQRVAVRSSANSEDLEKVSGAGLHDSVLGVDVKSKTSLEEAVLQVWSSMFTLRAVQSRHAAGLPLYEGIAMGVLVQPMVSRMRSHIYSFIAFSKDAVANDESVVYIEMCVGLGETLASANEPGTPYRLVVQKRHPNEVSVRSLANFAFGLEDAEGGPKRVRIDYSKERLSTDSAFLAEVAQNIASVVVGVENGYGMPMDMEGVVTIPHDGQRQIHLVQARPIVER